MALKNDPRPRVLIIIPAYNEAGNIQKTIARVKKYCPAMDIVVIDDGSRDDTFIVAAASGVLTLKHPYNRGIGTTMQTGYMYAARYGYDVAVQCDGDGQHPEDAIPSMVETLWKTNADMVIGSRYLAAGGFKSSAVRRVGIRFFSWLIRTLTGLCVTDPTSGFRAVNRRVIERFAAHYPEDYPEPEVLLTLSRRDFRIYEVPVVMKEREAGKSSIGSRRSIYYMFKVTTAMCIDMIRSTRT